MCWKGGGGVDGAADVAGQAGGPLRPISRAEGCERTDRLICAADRLIHARGGAAGRRRQTALLMPLGQWAAFCCLFVWWVFVFVYLAASGTWDQVQT